MGFRYLANKRDFQRQLRARRAAEIANGGGLGVVKLPPLKRNLRGRMVSSQTLAKGTELTITIQDNEVVGLQQNVLAVKFGRVNKATFTRLQKMTCAVGLVRRPHMYAPVVDVSVELEPSTVTTNAGPTISNDPPAK